MKNPKIVGKSTILSHLRKIVKLIQLKETHRVKLMALKVFISNVTKSIFTFTGISRLTI